MSETSKQPPPVVQLADAIFKRCVLEECDGLWFDRAKAVGMIEVHTESALAAATKQIEEFRGAIHYFSDSDNRGTLWKEIEAMDGSQLASYLIVESDKQESYIDLICQEKAAATKRAEDLQAHYDRDTAKLQQEIARLTAANGGNYWRWQGDGGDYLESLTCPILIDVGQLHEIFSVNREAETRRNQILAELGMNPDGSPRKRTLGGVLW